jgi:hypothetical protein
MHALVKDGVLVKYPYSVTDAKRDNPNVSFPANPSDVCLADFGVLRVFFSSQPDIAADQVLTEESPVFSETDQRWTQVWVTRNKTAEEIDSEIASKAAEIRSTRDHLLAESDWTQLADAPVDQAAWAAYRQALREIPSQEGFPWEVTWAVEP